MAVEIRRMGIGELELALAWAAAEGWNPGREDAAAFFAADPRGFWMGWVDGVPAVSISTVSYGGQFGFVGLYICRPELRGRGHGLALWQAALATLSDPVVGLDGVVERIETYRRSGFEFAHRNRRYGAVLEFAAPQDERLRPIDASLLLAVSDFDVRHFGVRRDSFLVEWLTGAASRMGMALIEDGRVTGYGVIRACGEGRKVGPLFAASAADADLLLRALVAPGGRGMVFLDVPEPNRAATTLAERHGMTPVFETARMYRGAAPKLPLQDVFGITTFELG